MSSKISGKNQTHVSDFVSDKWFGDGQDVTDWHKALEIVQLVKTRVYQGARHWQGMEHLLRLAEVCSKTWIWNVVASE